YRMFSVAFSRGGWNGNYDARGFRNDRSCWTPWLETIAANVVMNRIRQGVGRSVVSEAAKGAVRKPARDRRASGVDSLIRIRYNPAGSSTTQGKNRTRPVRKRNDGGK